MSDRTALGDRMKRYEEATRAILPGRTYSVVRVDGRHFHSFLRNAARPFDSAVVAAMDAVAEALCAEMSGAVFAYTQSDECSVLLADFGSPHTQPWFGGVVQKIASVAASIATVAFNRRYTTAREGAYATFDARVFTIPHPVEVANYFLWRQRDCVRNSISMAAQAVFPHRELQSKNGDQLQEMLWQRGINWNDYDPGLKHGRVCTRHTGEQEITYVDKRSGAQNTVTAVRSWWEISPAPHFTAQPDGWLAQTIPPLPSLAPAPAAEVVT